MEVASIVLLTVLLQQAFVGASCFYLNATIDVDNPPYADSPSIHQLAIYAATHPKSTAFAENAVGIVYPTLTASQAIGSRGPILLQDFFLIEKLQAFSRDNIPARVVHAKGAGARGYFEVTNDISRYTKAGFLQPGKRTKVVARLSGANADAGGPDTFLNDFKGFAVKFYTEEGIHDLLSLNVRNFFLRDAVLFDAMNRAFKRNPQTHLFDQSSLMDMISERTEMTTFLLLIMSDTIVPKSYRSVRAFALNTYKMVNSHGDAVYVKFHWVPHTKQEFFTLEEAIEMYAVPDVLILDLYDNIAKKNFPSWTLSIQVMTFDQAEKHPENPFDPTKNWKTDEYPLIPVGTLTLNENHKNYFINVEQIAFSPSNMVRGIEPSPDRVLQARLFTYPDAQLYRLGTNFAQIPVNACPFEVKTYRVNGPMNVGRNGGDAPDYYPNTFHGINSNENRSFKQKVFHVSGDVDRVDTGNDDNFTPAKYHWEHEICDEERKGIISNLITNLSPVEKRIQRKVLQRNLYTVNKELGDKVKAGLHL